MSPHWRGSELFLFQIPALAQAGFRVLAVDMKGYGESSAPSGGLAVLQLSVLVMPSACLSSPTALSSPGPRSEQAALQGGLTSPSLPSSCSVCVCALWAPEVSPPHTLNEFKKPNGLCPKGVSC